MECLSTEHKKLQKRLRLLIFILQSQYLEEMSTVAMFQSFEVQKWHRHNLLRVLKMVPQVLRNIGLYWV